MPAYFPKKTYVLLACALVVCSCKQPSQAATAPNTPAAGKAAPVAPKMPELQVESHVAHYLIRAVDQLPAPARPQHFKEGEFCSYLQITTPKTQAARDAMALGWVVTSELVRGQDTVIGIFSRGSDGTSGTCYIADGSVVVYRKGAPVAIVYDTPKPDEASRVGGVLESETPNRLHLSDFTPAGAPDADVVLESQRISIKPLPAQVTVCGNLALPNMYRSIKRVRAALLSSRWRPASTQNKADGHEASEGYIDPRIQGYHAQGWTEFEECSGTGYGFCKLNYTHPSSAALTLVTAGDAEGPGEDDAPFVTSYEIACPKDTPRKP